MPGSLWKNRVPEGEDDAPAARPPMPKQRRGRNAADEDPPRGYIQGIVTAENANNAAISEMDAIVTKMQQKGGAGKLTRKERELVEKIDRNPKRAGRLLGSKDKKAVEKVVEVIKDPGGAAKKGAKAAGGKAGKAAGEAVKRRFF